MLRRLGNRLTLLNVIISGAILLGMALTALSIAERMIATQNERDLGQYARSLTASLLEATRRGIPIQVQAPGNYAFYLENGTGEGAFSATSVTGPTNLDQVVGTVREALEDLSEKAFALDAASPEENMAWATATYAVIPLPGTGVIRGEIERRVGQMSPEERAALWEAVQEGGVTLERAVPISLVSSVENLLITGEKGIKYRVFALVLQSGENESLIMVLQDRAEELAARYRLRWMFAGAVAGGLLLLVLGSMYLSGRAIRPIDASIRQQRAFVAAASHELRTPVTALRANAEVLADAPLGEYAPYLDSVRSVGERMSLLINDLIDLARADAGELSVRMHPINTEEVAEKALQWMRPLADARQVRMEESLSPVEMVGDSDRLRQILLALLDNALRYTPAGGTVSVSVGKEGHGVRLRVADTGPGIPDEHKPRVFDRFYRIDAARSRDSGGAGLGLSVVRQLVEQMEGTITLADNTGGGTVFEMRFKAVQ